MARYRLDLAYDGTRYSGWQRQPNARTVQGTLEKALTQMQGGVELTTAGASRTDAGVHAEGQVAIFDYEGRLKPADFLRGLNALTPEDIVIRAVTEVDAEFHPRFASRGKWYRYLVWEGRHGPPAITRRVWPHGPHLDIDAMRRAASHLVGEHDFSAFRASDCEARNPVRRLESITLDAARTGYLAPLHSEGSRLVTIDLRGNAFLKYMVRIIVGTLVEVGLHKRDPDELVALILGRDRRLAGRTAPPTGLTLVTVFFEEGASLHADGLSAVSPSAT